MNKQDVLTLYEYNYWASARILDSAERLTAEQYTAPVAGISHGSARATLVHTLAAEQIWRLRCLDGVSPATLLNEDNLPTLESLRAQWADEKRKMRARLEGLSETALRENITYSTTGGRTMSQRLDQLLTHVVNHVTQHRAEAAVILTAFGCSPGDVDLIVYLRSLTEDGKK